MAAPFLLVGLGRAPFDDPGEGMHVEIARELAIGRDPFALTLNGVRYADKPPLLYALLAGAVAVGGPREAVARAVPAAAALIAIAATAGLGARLCGAAGGLLAGVALLTSLGFYAFGRYVRPETLLLAAVATGFALILGGLAEHRRSLVVGGWVAFGLAGLAKDPLAALAAPAAVGLALALTGRLRPLSRWMPWPGVVAWVVLAIGWWLPAEARTPGFVWYTVVDNHVLNVLRVRRFPDEDVPLGAGLFLTVAALGAAPWIIAAGLAVARLARGRAWREPAEFAWVVLAVWATGVLALTTLAPFRLPHYGLPAYPAIALLAARGWLRHGGRRLVIVHALALAVAAAGLAAVAVTPGGSRLLLDATDVGTRKLEAAGRSVSVPDADVRRLGRAAALVTGLGAAALAALASRRRVRPPAAVIVVVGTMLVMLPVTAVALARMSASRAVRDIALEVRRRVAAGDVLVHEGPIENSGALEWYSGRRPVIVDGRRSVLGFGATLDGAAGTFWDGPRLGEAWRDRRVWIVTARPPGATLVTGLPAPRVVAAAGGRWLYVNRE